MKLTPTFKEARRLYNLGLAIIWLHPKSKRPVESGWTTGPRAAWEHLAKTYTDGLNIGVRLGTPSKLDKGYLTVIDVDVKSKDHEHRKEAIAAAKALLGGTPCPSVLSGRGGGSRHFYCLTSEPFKTFNPAQSKDIVKVAMPSKKPSKKELATLSEKEIAAGIRLSHAWEISLYSDGRQVVLPPSIHPDSGKEYVWGQNELNSTDNLPLVVFNIPKEEVKENETSKGTRLPHPGVSEPADALTDFILEPVELSWLPIKPEIREGILHGVGVTDRSGYLLPASAALISAGLSKNEILTVLTDPDTFLGACAYEHAQTKDRTRAAAWVYKYTLRKVSDERDAAKIFSAAGPIQAARKLSPEEEERQTEEILSERHWTQDLIRNGSGVITSLVGNVVLILKNAVGEDVVRRDEFAFRDTYTYDTPWGGKKDGTIADDDIANIKFWLGQQFGFEPKKEVIYDALTVMACQNAFDPVKDMLGGLPAWDEVPRLNTWLKDNFEAKGDPEYLAQVFRKWMFAMVMRVYQPGSKFDWMPIFEGAQGVGKSSFGRVLVGDKHFLDWLPNLNDKDSALSLQGMWGVEMGELSQFRKNELENIKAFISRTVDKLRPPYGRRLMESARRCVFFGTTNRATYLTDDTGNRRFKPLEVGHLNFEALKRDRLQLFAEAKWLFDNKKETESTLELTGQAKLFERQIHGEKMIEDESHLMFEAMQDFIEKSCLESVPFDFEKFKILDLFGGVGPLTNWKADNRNSQYAAKMLKRLKGVSRVIKGRKYWKLDRGGGFVERPDTLDFF